MPLDNTKKGWNPWEPGGNREDDNNNNNNNNNKTGKSQRQSEKNDSSSTTTTTTTTRDGGYRHHDQGDSSSGGNRSGGGGTISSSSSSNRSRQVESEKDPPPSTTTTTTTKTNFYHHGGGGGVEVQIINKRELRDGDEICFRNNETNEILRTNPPIRGTSSSFPFPTIKVPRGQEYTPVIINWKNGDQNDICDPSLWPGRPPLPIKKLASENATWTIDASTVKGRTTNPQDVDDDQQQQTKQEHSLVTVINHDDRYEKIYFRNNKTGQRLQREPIKTIKGLTDYEHHIQQHVPKGQNFTPFLIEKDENGNVTEHDIVEENNDDDASSSSSGGDNKQLQFWSRKDNEVWEIPPKNTTTTQLSKKRSTSISVGFQSLADIKIHLEKNALHPPPDPSNILTKQVYTVDPSSILGKPMKIDDLEIGDKFLAYYDDYNNNSSSEQESRGEQQQQQQRLPYNESNGKQLGYEVEYHNQKFLIPGRSRSFQQSKDSTTTTTTTTSEPTSDAAAVSTPTRSNTKPATSTTTSNKDSTKSSHPDHSTIQLPSSEESSISGPAAITAAKTTRTSDTDTNTKRMMLTTTDINPPPPIRTTTGGGDASPQTTSKSTSESSSLIKNAPAAAAATTNTTTESDHQDDNKQGACSSTNNDPPFLPPGPRHSHQQEQQQQQQQQRVDDKMLITRTVRVENQSGQRSFIGNSMTDPKLISKALGPTQVVEVNDVDISQVYIPHFWEGGAVMCFYKQEGGDRRIEFSYDEEEQDNENECQWIIPHNIFYKRCIQVTIENPDDQRKIEIRRRRLTRIILNPMQSRTVYFVEIGEKFKFFFQETGEPYMIGDDDDIHPLEFVATTNGETFTIPAITKTVTFENESGTHPVLLRKIEDESGTSSTSYIVQSSTDTQENKIPNVKIPHVKIGQKIQAFIYDPETEQELGPCFLPGGAELDIYEINQTEDRYRIPKNIRRRNRRYKRPEIPKGNKELQATADSNKTEMKTVISGPKTNSSAEEDRDMENFDGHPKRLSNTNKEAPNSSMNSSTSNTTDADKTPSGTKVQPSSISAPPATAANILPPNVKFNKTVSVNSEQVKAQPKSNATTATSATNLTYDESNDDDQMLVDSPSKDTTTKATALASSKRSPTKVCSKTPEPKPKTSRGKITDMARQYPLYSTPDKADDDAMDIDDSGVVNNDPQLQATVTSRSWSHTEDIQFRPGKRDIKSRRKRRNPRKKNKLKPSTSSNVSTGNKNEDGSYLSFKNCNSSRNVRVLRIPCSKVGIFDGHDPPTPEIILEPNETEDFIFARVGDKFIVQTVEKEIWERGREEEFEVTTTTIDTGCIEFFRDNKRSFEDITYSRPANSGKKQKVYDDKSSKAVVAQPQPMPVVEGEHSTKNSGQLEEGFEKDSKDVQDDRRIVNSTSDSVASHLNSASAEESKETTKQTTTHPSNPTDSDSMAVAADPTSSDAPIVSNAKNESLPALMKSSSKDASPRCAKSGSKDDGGVNTAGDISPPSNDDNKTRHAQKHSSSGAASIPPNNHEKNGKKTDSSSSKSSLKPPPKLPTSTSRTPGSSLGTKDNDKQPKKTDISSPAIALKNAPATFPSTASGAKSPAPSANIVAPAMEVERDLSTHQKQHLKATHPQNSIIGEVKTVNADGDSPDAKKEGIITQVPPSGGSQVTSVTTSTTHNNDDKNNEYPLDGSENANNNNKTYKNKTTTVDEAISAARVLPSTPHVATTNAPAPAPASGSLLYSQATSNDMTTEGNSNHKLKTAEPLRGPSKDGSLDAKLLSPAADRFGSDKDPVTASNKDASDREKLKAARSSINGTASLEKVTTQTLMASHSTPGNSELRAKETPESKAAEKINKVTTNNATNDEKKKELMELDAHPASSIAQPLPLSSTTTGTPSAAALPLTADSENATDSLNLAFPVNGVSSKSGAPLALPSSATKTSQSSSAAEVPAACTIPTSATTVIEDASGKAITSSASAPANWTTTNTNTNAEPRTTTSSSSSASTAGGATSKSEQSTQNANQTSRAAKRNSKEAGKALTADVDQHSNAEPKNATDPPLYCYTCSKPDEAFKHKNCFSPEQWSKENPQCQDCIKRLPKKQCTVCGEEKQSNDFSNNQWDKPRTATSRVCLQCRATQHPVPPTKQCSVCGEEKKSNEFSPTQWRRKPRNATSRVCKACVAHAPKRSSREANNSNKKGDDSNEDDLAMLPMGGDDDYLEGDEGTGDAVSDQQSATVSKPDATAAAAKKIGGSSNTVRKICMKCGDLKPRECFGKKQWRKKRGDTSRICLDCPACRPKQRPAQQSDHVQPDDGDTDEPSDPRWTSEIEKFGREAYLQKMVRRYDPTTLSRPFARDIYNRSMKFKSRRKRLKESVRFGLHSVWKSDRYYIMLIAGTICQVRKLDENSEDDKGFINAGKTWMIRHYLMDLDDDGNVTHKLAEYAVTDAFMTLILTVWAYGMLQEVYSVGDYLQTAKNENGGWVNFEDPGYYDSAVRNATFIAGKPFPGDKRGELVLRGLLDGNGREFVANVGDAKEFLKTARQVFPDKDYANTIGKLYDKMETTFQVIPDGNAVVKVTKSEDQVVGELEPYKSEAVPPPNNEFVQKPDSFSCQVITTLSVLARLCGKSRIELQGLADELNQIGFDMAAGTRGDLIRRTCAKYMKREFGVGIDFAPVEGWGQEKQKMVAACNNGQAYDLIGFLEKQSKEHPLTFGIVGQQCKHNLSAYPPKQPSSNPNPMLIEPGELRPAKLSMENLRCVLGNFEPVRMDKPFHVIITKLWKQSSVTAAHGREQGRNNQGVVPSGGGSQGSGRQGMGRGCPDRGRGSERCGPQRIGRQGRSQPGHFDQPTNHGFPGRGEGWHPGGRGGRGWHRGAPHEGAGFRPQGPPGHGRGLGRGGPNGGGWHRSGPGEFMDGGPPFFRDNGGGPPFRRGGGGPRGGGGCGGGGRGGGGCNRRNSYDDRRSGGYGGGGRGGRGGYNDNRRQDYGRGGHDNGPPRQNNRWDNVDMGGGRGGRHHHRR